MSRKTYSLSAVAIAASASLSFSSADGAEAFAQADLADAPVDGVDGVKPGEERTEPGDETIELVPLDAPVETGIAFVSKAVIQPLPEPAEAAITTEARSLGELVSALEPSELTDQMHCLAGAVYFEARGEPLAGQLAVAQVVINRAQDPRWPASYCGVVHQRAQFSFVKNGRMPRIRTSTAAWQRATAIARIAHEGMWNSEAGDAVYFHARYVRPSWSHRKERLAQIDTHIFYR